MRTNVVGSGALAELLRQKLMRESHTETMACHCCVIFPTISQHSSRVADLDDDDIDEAWEQPIRDLITALVEAKTSGASNIVVIIPTIALSGGAEYSLQAAVAEAAHVLVKSAARQWGVDGVVVNCVAVAPEEFGIDSLVSGDVSLAPRALGEAQSALDVIAWLCSDGASSVTGQTLVVDGGLWM